MVRLIDIVLILLFGFISISEIDRKSKVRLAETKDLPVTHVDQEQILVVGIVSPTEYIIEKGEGIVFHDQKQLFNYISFMKNDYASRGKDMKVRIRSNWFLPAQYAFDLAIYCEADSIERGLDVRITSSKK